MHIDLKAEPGLATIIQAAYPDRKDTTIVVYPFRPLNVNSYWDGGCRNDYALVSLTTLEVVHLPESHPYFTLGANGKPIGNVELKQLPEGTCLVHCPNRGSITVWLHPENVATFLPTAVSLSYEEKMTLYIVASYRKKDRPCRFRWSGLGTYGADNPWILSLSYKGLVKVTKGGMSITTKGRNVPNYNLLPVREKYL